MFNEGLLDRVQAAIARQAFNGGDRLTICGRRQNEAGCHRPPIQDDCTGAAVAGTAAFLGPHQPQLVTERIHQKSVWGNRKRIRFTIYQ